MLNYFRPFFKAVQEGAIESGFLIIVVGFNSLVCRTLAGYLTRNKSKDISCADNHTLIMDSYPDKLKLNLKRPDEYAFMVEHNSKHVKAGIGKILTSEGMIRIKLPPGEGLIERTRLTPGIEPDMDGHISRAKAIDYGI
ncbi:hypothetical protein [uncultured Pantoea sp.]|uniref:hypothetical protein n=1 Tax=uncultured Pantoea sp. TaxID=218084 RepID=UPI002590C91A|nr:hypothetical protein [uncultured Pantoea sp.]